MYSITCLVATQTKIAETILTVAAQRAPDKTVCPSEIARQLFPANWRSYMNTVRAVAVQLQKTGKISITQKGKPVDVNLIKGAIRIKLI